MTCPNVYIENSDFNYESMFTKRGWSIVDHPTKADLVQFTGGEDVYPPLYGEKTQPRTYSSARRDYIEQQLFHACIEKGIPMAGICRGGQFLNVMNGGRMIQHIEGHANGRLHQVTCPSNNETFYVTSTHHQMMVPHPEAEIVLTANIINKDIEALWYSRTNSFCFQPHPEYSHSPKECTDFYFKRLESYFNLSS